jgi:UDP-N-acetylmuramate dehydrogenase
VNGVAIPAGFETRVLRDEPMSRHTSWHVGGPADGWFAPKDVEELAGFLRQLPRDVPVTWVGLGSNLLVRDGGIRGVVISVHGILNALERVGDLMVRAEAGVACARLGRQCAKWQLGPADFFAGIPGTVGGALAMNAGAWGGETWPHVVEVEVIDRSGERRQRAASEYRFGYRSVTPPVAGEWFLAATFRFEPRPQATDRRMELRFGIHESPRRARRAADRIGRPQGSSYRRRIGVHQARQFHHQWRAGDGRGSRSTRAPCAGDSAAGTRRPADA